MQVHVMMGHIDNVRQQCGIRMKKEAALGDENLSKPGIELLTLLNAMSCLEVLHAQAA